MIPLVYVLMTHKSEEAYTKVFHYINDHIFDMKCASFMADFEVAIRNALHAIVPGVPIHGCWFHFCRSLQRTAGQISGLLKYFNDNGQAGIIYKKLRLLALLPSDQILFGFNLLKQQAIDLHNDRFNEFVEYIHDQWIIKVSYSLSP